MRSKGIEFVIVAIGSLVLATRPAVSQEKGDKPAPPDKPTPAEKPSPADKAGEKTPDASKPPEMSPDDMMKMIEQMSGPSEQHKLLEPLAGAWKQTTKIWLVPGTQPLTATAQTHNEWVLGKRFLVHHGRTLEGSLRFEYIYLYGYDTRIKKFTVFGIDTFGTYSVSAEGDFDETNKTFTFTGVTDEPGRGKMPFKFVLRLENEKQYTFEAYMPTPNGGWFKMVEITSQRESDESQHKHPHEEHK